MTQNNMKVAVITPYHTEPSDMISRCLDSVRNQTYKNIKHFLISDGHSNKLCEYKNQEIEHIILPTSHHDAGATPRMIGAFSAFSQGYDAISFLDVDNWYMNNHVQKMVELMEPSGVDIVTATRTIYSRKNEMLYVDAESNGTDFCDTNCMFLNKKISHLLSFWITQSELRMVSDRIFWNACIANKVSKLHSSNPTVCYSTKWAAHYHYARVDIPDDSVWMHLHNNTYTTITNKEKLNG